MGKMRTKKADRDKLCTQTFFNVGSGPSCSLGHVVCPPNCTGVSPSETYRDTEMELKFTTFESRIQSLQAQSEAEDNNEFLKKDRAHVDETCELKDMPVIEKLGRDADDFLKQIRDRKLSMVLQEQRKYVELGGKGSSPSDKLTARLGHTAGYFQFQNEILNSATCQLHLFNIDKPFGFFKEDCQSLQCRATTWTGNKVVQGAMTLRNVFRATFIDEHTVTEKQRKKPDLKKTLERLIRNTTFAIKELQAVIKQIPDEDAQAPALPRVLEFEGNPVPDTVALPIRDSIDFLMFLHEGITTLSGELSELRDTLRRAMLVWASSSSPAWQYARAHVHEFPEVRKYVWTRNHLLSSYETGRWEHVKILTHYGQGIGRATEAWDNKAKTARRLFPSLDELLATNDEFCAKLEQDIKDVVLQMPPPTNLLNLSTRP